MNTSTRATFANADLAHASTATTPLMRPYGVIMPQAKAAATTPALTSAEHCSQISAAYTRALANPACRMPITNQLKKAARNWLSDEVSFVTLYGFWPLFIDREVLLTETIAGFSQPRSATNDLRLVPISSLHNEGLHPLWSLSENLLFRFVHDWNNYQTKADATFTGGLAVTRHILTETVRSNPPLARFLASESVKKAALSTVLGAYPDQIIANNILELI